MKSSTKRSILIASLLLILAIIFETSQQLFYVRKYNISPNATFIDLFKSQSYQWVIWLLLALPLYYFSKKNAEKAKSLNNLLKTTAVIFGLVAISILIISAVQLYRSSTLFTFSELTQEFIPFFLFQKAPIFTLGYIALSIIFYFYFENRALYFEVQKLSELKDINLELYNQLKSKINDKTTILNIKIGNKRKIVSVDEILWIEADDYCVKVHLDNGNSYTMRSSLKKLEEKLDTTFIRVHRKAIVNMNMVQEFNTSGSPKLILRNHEEIPISKSNFKSVKEYIS